MTLAPSASAISCVRWRLTWGAIVRLPSLNLLLGDAEPVGKTLLSYVGGYARLNGRRWSSVSDLNVRSVTRPARKGLVFLELLAEHFGLAAERVARSLTDSGGTSGGGSL